MKKKSLEEKEITTYVVKLFAQSPFDKSDYIKDVQVLCKKETGEPFAHLDSPYNWEGYELTSEEVSFEGMSKRSKHLVVGDSVTFGSHGFFEGIIERIELANEEEGYNWNDTIHLKECFNTLAKIEDLKDLCTEETPFNRTVTRNDLQHKRYFIATIKNDDVNWKKIDKDWFTFSKTQQTPEAILTWWKERVQPKQY